MARRGAELTSEEPHTKGYGEVWAGSATPQIARKRLMPIRARSMAQADAEAFAMKITELRRDRQNRQASNDPQRGWLDRKLGDNSWTVRPPAPILKPASPLYPQFQP